MSIKKQITRTIKRLLSLNPNYQRLQAGIDELKMLNARTLINEIKRNGVYEDIRDAEFKVFSQFGEDGIIQYLIHNIPALQNLDTFVEFGVENYMESNTRFLLVNNNWRGLVIDGSRLNVDDIKGSPLYWRHDLTAVCAFINRDNINHIISANGFTGDIGILSIDIDGNDYWVWKAIDVVNPVVVIAEYNSVFGKERAVTIPYDESFVRTTAHYSNLYWGCSLGALAHMAKEKGYALVGSNRAGNNAFFVRKDMLGDIPEVKVADAYIESRFRESRDSAGKLDYTAPAGRLDRIRDQVLFDVELDKNISIEEM